MRTRRPASRLVSFGGALALSSGLLGYMAGHVIKSPAQALAEAAPPQYSTLTAPVTRTPVVRTVTFDGTVAPQFQTAVRVQQGGADTAVLTRVERDGSKVAAGDVIAEVSGKPMIVLSGALPAYRTMAPGMAGPDIVQLQQALAAVGRPTGDPLGQYGSGTSAAIADLYDAHGYEATRIGDDLVEAAQDAARSADRSLEQLRQQKADALTVQFAEQDLAHAQAAVSEALAGAGAEVALGELVFVPALPARVTDVAGQVGDVMTDKLMTLASGPLVVRGTATNVDAQRIDVDDQAKILFSPAGTGRGRVVRVATDVPTPGDPSSDQAAAGGTVFVLKTRKPLVARLDGTDARVIVEVARSSGDGLTVPLSAITTTADGETVVHVVDAGRTIVVPVRTGFSGDGYIQVVPRRDRDLSAGATVVIGTGGGA